MCGIKLCCVGSLRPIGAPPLPLLFDCVQGAVSGDNVPAVQELQGSVLQNPVDVSFPCDLTEDYLLRLAGDFTPSRGRARDGVWESADVAVQRCGSTLPTLLPENCPPARALLAAASINPFGSALFANFATAIVADTKANLSSPEDVSALRASVSVHLPVWAGLWKISACGGLHVYLPPRPIGI